MHKAWAIYLNRLCAPNLLGFNYETKSSVIGVCTLVEHIKRPSCLTLKILA